jgi:hypothetical protein
MAGDARDVLESCSATLKNSEVSVEEGERKKNKETRESVMVLAG